jgi:hypothetical protein
VVGNDPPGRETLQRLARLATLAAFAFTSSTHLVEANSDRVNVGMSQRRIIKYDIQETIYERTDHLGNARDGCILYRALLRAGLCQ